MGRQNFNKRDHIAKVNILHESRDLINKGLLMEQIPGPTCYGCSNGQMVTNDVWPNAMTTEMGHWANGYYTTPPSSTSIEFCIKQGTVWGDNGLNTGYGMTQYQATVDLGWHPTLPPPQGTMSINEYWFTDQALVQAMCASGSTGTMEYCCTGGVSGQYQCLQQPIGTGCSALGSSGPYPTMNACQTQSPNCGGGGQSGCLDPNSPNFDPQATTDCAGNMVPPGGGFGDTSCCGQGGQCDLSCVDINGLTPNGQPYVQWHINQWQSQGSPMWDMATSYVPGDQVCHLDPVTGFHDIYSATGFGNQPFSGIEPQMGITAGVWASPVVPGWEAMPLLPTCWVNPNTEWWCSVSGIAGPNCYDTPIGQGPNDPNDSGPEPTLQDCQMQCQIQTYGCMDQNATNYDPSAMIPCDGGPNQPPCIPGTPPGPNCCCDYGTGGGDYWCEVLPCQIPPCPTQCVGPMPAPPPNMVGGPFTTPQDCQASGCGTITSIAGCNDPQCQNYDPNAIGCPDPMGNPDPNDTSCCTGCGMPIPGCLDPSSSNYNPSATVDCSGNPVPPGGGYGDTSCCTPPPIPGCTDQNALNYNSSATVDDGSCDYGWNCIDTWPEKPGIAKKCKKNTNPNQQWDFVTKQDCIDSGCEPLPADVEKGEMEVSPFAPNSQSKRGEDRDSKELKEQINKMKSLWNYNK